MYWTITTTLGSTEGSLIDCLRWQAQVQGGLAELVGPEGQSFCLEAYPYCSAEDDPYRDVTDLTPEELADLLITKLELEGHRP